MPYTLTSWKFRSSLRSVSTAHVKDGLGNFNLLFYGKFKLLVTKKPLFDKLHDQIVQVIRLRQDAVLDKIIHTLHRRSPEFAGVCQQVKKLLDITRKEWKRTRRADELPKVPKNIGYGRRLPDVVRRGRN